ncbi:MAG: prepilin-type N-terminal cleavage/methylation domain-containing protein [Candidatus Omnitrophota bacterium]
MNKKSKQGFILVEILVSLLVFSVGVLLLIQSLSNITKSNQNIRDNYFAMLLIDNLLNRLYAKEIIAPLGIESMSNKDFTWQIDYSNSLEGLKEILLKVNWQSKGKDYSAELKHQIIVVEQ